MPKIRCQRSFLVQRICYSNCTMDRGKVSIAHVVCAYPPYRGGMGNVAFEYVERLRARGYDARVYSIMGKQATPPPAKPEPAPPGSPPLVKGGISDPRYVHRIRGLAQIGNAGLLPQLVYRLRDFDLVHLHYPFFGGAEPVVIGKMLRRGQKLVMTYHMDAAASGAKGAIFSAYQRVFFPWIANHADRILVSSLDYAGHSALADLNVMDRVEEHPFGIDLERFYPGQEDKLREELAIARDKPVLLFVGGMDRAHAFKGIPTMFEALAKIHSQEWHLVLVGSGELKETYRAQTRLLGIESRVTFAGNVSQENLPRYYRLADIHLFPSTKRAEAFGLVALEAAASGVPTIASDLPGVRTVVANGETGLLVPPSDHAALRGAITSLLLDTDTRLRFGLAARSRAERLFSWDPLIDRLEQTYGSILSVVRSPFHLPT